MKNEIKDLGLVDLTFEEQLNINGGEREDPKNKDFWEWLISTIKI